MVVEADEAVPWTKPDDLPYAPDKPLPALGGGPRGNFLVLMADGVSSPSRRSSMRCCYVGRSPGTTSSRSTPTAWDPSIRLRPRRRLNPARTPTGRRPVRPATAEPGKPSRPSPSIESSSAAKCSTRMGTLMGAPQFISFGPPPSGSGSRILGRGAGRNPRRRAGPMAGFEILIDRAEWDDVCSIPNRFGPQVRTFPLVAATALRYGPSWVLLPKPEARADVTLQLVKDEVPIEGRILDLEGRPVPGATVTTEEIIAAPGEDLTPVIKALNSGMSGDVPPKFLAASVVGLPPTLTTDRDGRFRLAGIGQERTVSLRISGSTIQTGDIFVMTRLGIQASSVKHERPKLVIANSPSAGVGPMVYPARFEHAAGPTKPIEGVVSDRATGRPLPGAVILPIYVYERNGGFGGMGGIACDGAKADAAGRFRLVGAPKSPDLGIQVFSPEREPYLETIKRVGDTPGLAPIVCDVSLTRGITVRGRLVNGVSGRPVRGTVHYFLLHENPWYDKLRDFRLTQSQVPTDDDGSFSIVALDGPGLLAAAAHSDRFTKGVGVDRIKLAKLLYNSYDTYPFRRGPGLLRYPGRAQPARRLERCGAHDRARPLEVMRSTCGLDRAPCFLSGMRSRVMTDLATSGPLMSPAPRRPGTSGEWSASTAAPVSPPPGTRSVATWPTAPSPVSAGSSPARRAPGRAGTPGGACSRRGRLCRWRSRTAQGLVGLPHALRARPAGRAAGAHVAQPFRHQRGEGQRPGMDAAAERHVPPPCPGAVRRAPPGLCS